MIILKLLWRVIVMTFGIALALGAATVFLGTAIGREALAHVRPDTVFSVFFDTVDAVIALGVVVKAGILPWLVFVLLAEGFAWRGLLVHLAAGAVLAIIGPFAAGSQPSSAALQVAAATGLIVALIYWLIAGRSAGNWWRPPAELPADAGQTPPPVRP